MTKKITTLSLTIPFFFETLLRALLMNVDTFMLSRYSDKAVAAVGTIQQFAFFILVVYMMAATGASIIISQNLGAKKYKEATMAGQAALFTNFGLAIFFSIMLFLVANPLIGSLGLEPVVAGYARDYFKIYVSFSIFQAISLVFSGIIRSYGYSYQPLYVNIGTNVINVIGNYIFIFGAFGLPALGVKGVAVSTVFSQFLGAIAMIIITGRIPEINLFLKIRVESLKKYVKSILKIGIPSAGESMSYNLCQLVILYFVSSLGTVALASYTYAINFTRFAYMLAIALGNANQILVGYKIGSNDKEGAYRVCLNNVKWGSLSSFILSGIIAIFRFKIVGFLTDDPEIISTTANLFLLAVIHEIARPFNYITIAGLRGAGDVKYPVYVGIIMMWSISVTLSYLLGIYFGLGLIGIWIARLSEEWLRGGVILRRWFSRKWETKAII